MMMILEEHFVALALLEVVVQLTRWTASADMLRLLLSIDQSCSLHHSQPLTNCLLV